MKFIIICLALVGAAYGGITLSINNLNIQQRNLINNALNASLEQVRSDMPCGWPDSDPPIPPMAPLEVEHVPIDINIADSQIEGFFDDLRVDGLDGFITRQIAFSVITLRLTFNFIFPRIDLSGLYKNKGTIAGIPIHGEGPFTGSAFDITIVGDARLGVTNTFLEMREFNFAILIDRLELDIQNLQSDDGHTTDFLNRMFERLIPDLLRVHEEQISDTVREIVKPAANSVLNTMTLADLVDAITGSGETEEAPPRTPCVVLH